MPRNLVDRGWRVIGFDIDAAKRAELAAAGVTIAANVGQVAHDAPVIMTSLPDPAAAEDVARSIAGSGQPPRIVIELSTLTIADKLRFEAILKKARPCRAGLSAQRAPVHRQKTAISWSMPVAIATPLPDVWACSPISPNKARILASMANGSRMKFVANHLVAIHNVATAEAMILAERAGLDPKMVVDMVGPGAGGSRMFQMAGADDGRRGLRARDHEGLDLEERHGDHRGIRR